MTLTQGATAAGSTASVTMDVNFSPTSGDSAKDVTISLPPGLIADASIDGGACLSSATALAECQVGTGTATTPRGSAATTLYLVAPPLPGDLAGLAITGLAQPVVGDVALRPSVMRPGSA